MLGQNNEIVFMLFAVSECRHVTRHEEMNVGLRTDSVFVDSPLCRSFGRSVGGFVISFVTLRNIRFQFGSHVTQHLSEWVSHCVLQALTVFQLRCITAASWMCEAPPM